MIRNIWPPAPHEKFEDLGPERQRLVKAAEKVYRALQKRGDVAWFLQDMLRGRVCSPWQDGGEGSLESVRERPKGMAGSRREFARVWTDEFRDPDLPPIWEWEIWWDHNSKLNGSAGSKEVAENTVDEILRGKGYILP